MANKRTYYAMAAKPNGELLGGTSRIDLTQGYLNTLTGRQDNMAGGAVVDRIAKLVRGAVTCEDPTKFVDVIAATVSTLEWYAKESGASTFSKHVIDAPVIVGAVLNITKNGYANCSWNFEAPFAAADDYPNVVTFSSGGAAPTTAMASRLTYPRTVSHGAAAILHPTSLSISVQPTQVLREFGDTDTGVSAIDVVDWQPPVVTVGFQDQTEQTGPPTHELASALLAASMADLEANVKASGNGTNQVITLKNVQWTEDQGSHQVAGYTEHRIRGVAQWLDSDGATKRTWGDTNKILTFANQT